MKHVSRKSTAFTLIEMLTVIGILMALLGILLPVFFSVRAKSRCAVCLSNVRQVGLGVLMYAQDFDDVYPPYFDHLEGSRCLGNLVYSGSGKYWTEIVSPYIQRVRQNDAKQGGGQARLEDLPAVYLCPESSNNPTQPQNYKPGNLSGYGINDDIVDWWTPSHCGGFKPHALSAVAVPAQCLLLTETYDWFSPKHDRPGAALALSPLDSLTKKINGAIGTVDGRHGAGYRKNTVAQPADPLARNTVFFCDGHVASEPVGLLTRSAALWSITGNGTWP